MNKEGMKLELLLLSVVLLTTCSSFKIMFDCGKEVGFDERFWEVFQVSPQEDSEKAKQVSHYSPLCFKEFASFLYQTKEFEQIEVASKTNPVYSTLYKLVKEDSFQDFFSTHHVETLSKVAVKNRVSLDYPKNPSKLTESAAKSNAEWWSQNNYLYPFILLENLQIENDCNRKSCEKGKHKIKRIKRDNLALELPQRMEFSSWDDLQSKYSDSDFLSLAIPMAHLKWSLFSDFYQCPSIHLQTCLVIDLESPQSIVKGYLGEDIGLDQTDFFFSNKFIGNYGILLKEFIRFAEGIHFIHECGYAINLQYENLAIIPKDDEGFLFKLFLFTPEGYFNEFKSVNGKIRNGVETSEGTENELLFVIGKIDYLGTDWRVYLEILLNLTVKEELMYIPSPKFPNIEELEDKFLELDCCTDQDVFELFKRHLNDEIEECKVKELFKIEKK